MKKKILALNKELSGSKYHRTYLPLCILADKYPEEYEIHFFNEKHIAENIAKNYDIIYIHWTQLTKCELLSIWRDKYGFKIIQDVDDYWLLPQNHPTKIVMDKMIPQLENQLILADTVICSTEQLEEKVKFYNKETIVRKNFLPVGIIQSSINQDFKSEFNQFQINPRDFYRSSKLNVGICGSVSHLPDWLNLSNDLRRLKNDRFIQDNVNFIVSGYADTNEPTKKTWERIFNLFTYAKKERNKDIIIKPKTLRFTNPSNYMSNYTPIDILLCPLEKGEFNECKSNLKILESGINGSIPICNNLMYQNKINSDCFVESTNLYQTVYDLVRLWKKDLYKFNSLQKNIQHNILSYNSNLENKEINKLHKLFQNLVS
jgi:hypothetical protein